MYAICIRNTNQEGQLTIGKRYKIIQRGKLGDAIYIKCDDGRMWFAVQTTQGMKAFCPAGQ